MPASMPVIIGAGPSFSFAGTDTGGNGLGAALGAGAIPTTGVGGASGFIGGGQIGYNYQISSIVLGLEVDIDGATGRNSTTTVAGPDRFRTDCHRKTLSSSIGSARCAAESAGRCSTVF